jgi:hypothetical protein
MQELKDKARAWWHVKIGGLLVATGVAIVKPPGFGDALLSYINKKYGLGLPLEPSSWLGCALILAGMGLIVWGEKLRPEGQPRVPFVAFRHHSLEPFATPLLQEDLPPGFKDHAIREIDCDQSGYFSNGFSDPVGAVRLQLEKLTELRGARKAFRDTVVGYYGLAHIPLQFLAGFAMSTHAPVCLFDLNRQTNRWRPLQDRGPHLGLTVKTMEQPPGAKAVAIRICISYEITRGDITDVLPHPFDDIVIQLPTPRIDAIGSSDQVHAVCERFRKILDDIHSRVDKTQLVHVFYAGPAALGFSLGRQISRTVHHRILVHNYTPTDTPKYSWAVEVTSQTVPEMVRTTANGG